MQKLLRELKAFYKKHRRDLPWRHTHDPYKILVSEIMLQQTQVERVVPFYKRFIKKFPTVKALARAKLSDVLRLWSGLGYNRRAKFLYQAAKVLAAERAKKGEMNGSPTPFFALSVAELESLPGVGPYTARAIVVFAYNKPEVFIETNIRTVFIHSNILQNVGMISDKDILPLVEEALRKSNMEPRDFYAALMDYGSYLKKQGIKLNTKSKHYTKQSRFEGSRRQKRAAHVRKLLARGASDKELLKALHS